MSLIQVLFPTFTPTQGRQARLSNKIKMVHTNIIASGLTYSLALVRKQTIPTKQPPLVEEFSANLCG
jgi:hypothetical protein